MESAFRFELWRSLLLVKLQAFTKTGSGGAYGKDCGADCFQPQAVVESVFSKTLGLTAKQTVTEFLISVFSFRL